MDKISLINNVDPYKAPKQRVMIWICYILIAFRDLFISGVQLSAYPLTCHTEFTI